MENLFFLKEIVILIGEGRYVPSRPVQTSGHAEMVIQNILKLEEMEDIATGFCYVQLSKEQTNVKKNDIG